MTLPKKIVESLNKDVLNQLELATAIDHPGESGRARENVIRKLIRGLVAPSFGIDTGFVIDGQGNISRQIDIVVYRTDYHPLLEIGGVKHFLVESVCAVIENKADVGSRTILEQALENIASVKRLDRTGGGRNHILREGSGSQKLDPNNFNHQVFGTIVTQSSLGKDNLADALLHFLRSNQNRNEWFNLYIDVNSFAAYYAKDRSANDSAPGTHNTILTTDTSGAERLFISDPSTPGVAPPIADLAQELINFLRVAPLVDFLSTNYFWTESKGKEWVI